MLFITVIPLLVMIISDWYTRRVSIIALVIFALLCFICAIYKYNICLIAYRSLCNITLLFTLYIGVYVWFLVKGEKKRISQTFGSGDIGFIVSTAPLLQLYEYLLFILISCVASLLWWIIIYWITGKNRTIPFISTSGVCYIGYICSLSFY